MDKLLGFRKLGVTLLVFLTSVILTLVKTLSPDQFVELNKFIIPAFLAANLAEYVLKRKGESEDV